MKKLLIALAVSLAPALFAASPSFQQTTNIVKAEIVKSNNFNGTFTGNGAGLTNYLGKVPDTNITGTITVNPTSGVFSDNLLPTSINTSGSIFGDSSTLTGGGSDAGTPAITTQIKQHDNSIISLGLFGGDAYSEPMNSSELSFFIKKNDDGSNNGIYGNVANIIAIKENTNYNNIAGALIFQTHRNHAFRDPIESMRITSAGYVGIGTNAPDSLLHVAGNVHFDGTVTASGFAGNGSDLTNFNSRIVYTNFTTADLSVVFATPFSPSVGTNYTITSQFLSVSFGSVADSLWFDGITTNGFTAHQLGIGVAALTAKFKAVPDYN